MCACARFFPPHPLASWPSICIHFHVIIMIFVMDDQIIIMPLCFNAPNIFDFNFNLQIRGSFCIFFSLSLLFITFCRLRIFILLTSHQKTWTVYWIQQLFRQWNRILPIFRMLRVFVFRSLNCLHRRKKCIGNRFDQSTEILWPKQ